jgi:undecaprenyl diphosphate synthase
MDGLPSSPTECQPPGHVAIIMDGNGRWAQARGMPRIVGHRRGVEAVRRTLRAAIDLGVTYLTLYGFSSENWRRPEEEVRDLMGIMRLYLRGELAELHRQNVRLRVIGQRDRLASDIVALIENAEQVTRGNTRCNLTIALSYGGRDEIATAARRLAEQARRGELDPAAIDETMFGAHLFTADLPDPDLVIRTSGEKRISNFLLWQCAYSEMVFIDRLWPDFSKNDLADAIREFHGRERRFGASAGSTA